MIGTGGLVGVAFVLLVGIGLLLLLVAGSRVLWGRGRTTTGALMLTATFSLLLAAGIWVRSPARSAGLPPDTRALLLAASPEPVELTLASSWMFVGDERGLQPRSVRAQDRLVLRVPAAYVPQVRFSTPGGINQHRDAASAITFSFWSRSFDPVLPDLVADSAACRPPSRNPCAPLGTDGGLVAGRVAAGEFQVDVLLHNNTAAPANRRYQILNQVGLATLAPWDLPPCEFREDPALGMLVGRRPEGQRASSACNFMSTGFVDGSTGRFFFYGATFLMREADGTPRFGVRCPDFVGPYDGVVPRSCALVGYFGVWPIEMTLPSDRVGEWSGIFDRVQDFLARHVVSRTDMAP